MLFKRRNPTYQEKTANLLNLRNKARLANKTEAASYAIRHGLFSS